jgi:hypothetical protein
MRRRCPSVQIAATAIALLMTMPGAGADQSRAADDRGPDVQAALTAFEGYNQALVTKDYSALRDRYLQAPFVIIDDMPRMIPSVGAVADLLRKTRDSLETAGYATTTISRPRVSMLNRDRLLLNCRLTHRKQDGSVLSERANFYLMVNVAGMWKVAGIIPQDPVYLGKEN